MEEWKPIRMFQLDHYSVSSNGRIGNRGLTQIMDQYLNPETQHKGQYKVRLQEFPSGEIDDCAVALLVLHTFKPSGKHFNYWRHIDGNKQNNSIANLKWAKNPPHPDYL